MPWWAPLGGIVGAFAVVAGLVFVNKVGSGPFATWLITANILMSLVIDKFGRFGMEDQHPLSLWRMLGGFDGRRRHPHNEVLVAERKADFSHIGAALAFGGFVSAIARHAVCHRSFRRCLRSVFLRTLRGRLDGKFGLHTRERL
jgi:hypothetical protein